ncbi:hypothetical protein T492DRAFT_990018 [Pavlovales sp. CCMP2436]|nr:hypothetical protein T492DRAFT_990018 [Pavlovales sp. CCMP2436]
MIHCESDMMLAAMRAEHAHELSAAKAESKAAHHAMAEMRVRHDAVGKTLKQLQAEHRILGEDHARLTLVVELQARASAEEETRNELDLRAQLDRARRGSGTASGSGAPSGSVTSRLREEILLAAQELSNKLPVPAPRTARGHAPGIERFRAGVGVPAPPVPPSAPRRPGSVRGQSDLAERLRALEGAVLADDDSIAAREEAAALRRELEQREREAAQRDEGHARELAEMRGALSAAEARRLFAVAEAEKQQTVLRHQVTSLRNQVTAKRREVRESKYGTFATSPRVPAVRRASVTSVHSAPRPRPEEGGELAQLMSQINERMAKKGITGHALHDDDDDDDEFDNDDLAAQMRALALRRHSGVAPPRVPLSVGNGRLDPNHTALVQLKQNVRANANRARRPTDEKAARTVGQQDPAADGRRKTIATLRTRLERAKAMAA